jgi:hypothetical protein
MTEATDHFQRRLFSLIERCEVSCEQISVASRHHPGAAHSSGNLRRSREYEAIPAEMGLQKYAIEQREQFSLFGAQAISSLQALQFVGSDLFEDSLSQAMKISVPISHLEPSTNPIFYELQQSYCGLGLHYHTQNSESRRSASATRDGRPVKSAQNAMAMAVPGEQQETETRKKYIRLLKDGMHKKATGPKKIEHVGRSARKSEAGPSSPPSPLNDQTSLLTPTPLVMPPTTAEAKLPVQLATKPSEVFQVLKPSRSPHVSPSPQLSSFSTILSTLSQAIRADETTQEIFSLLSSSELTAEQKEVVAATLLSSAQLTHLLHSAPTHRKSSESSPTAFSPPSKQWSESLFHHRQLPLPDAVRASLLKSSSDPSMTLPTDIIGAPPLPLAPFPILSQLNMKSLSYLFEDLLREAEVASSKTQSLWTQRRNLITGGEKVKEQMERDQAFAASQLSQLFRSVQAEQNQLRHLMQWLAATALSKQRMETQVRRNESMLSEVESLEAACGLLLDNSRDEFLRKEEIAATTEEGLRLDTLVPDHPL